MISFIMRLLSLPLIFRLQPPRRDVTKGAALGGLARTMLFAGWKCDRYRATESEVYYQRATKDASDAVIALGVYDLLPNYKDLFIYANEEQ